MDAPESARPALVVAKRMLLLLALAGLAPSSLAAQVLTLEEARARALEVSPSLAAGREAVLAAAGRERQAGAFPNPTLSYAREQTSRSGLTTWQNIALVEQRLDLSGARGARRDAAGLRRQAVAAGGAALEAEVLYEVTRTYVAAVAADRRAAHADRMAEAFDRARQISGERLAQGDVSGYAHRRIALEAGRYASLRAEARRIRHQARLALGALLTASADSLAALETALEDSVTVAPLTLSLDSLRALALQSRPELQAARMETEASAAEARAAGRDAVPVPLVGLGFKNERAPGDPSAARGFVLQVSLPLPLWDTRRGAVQAFQAEVRQHSAGAEALRREVVREVELAWAGAHAAELELNALRPQLGEEARLALQAAEAAYLEGEISLVEWLDAVRAYYEAESTFATLRADHLIQRAALERAVGTRLY